MPASLPLPLIGVCVCVYVCAHMWVLVLWVHVWAQVHGYGDQKLMLGIFSQLLSTCFKTKLREGLSLNLVLTSLAGLVGQCAPGTCLSRCSPGMCRHCQLFIPQCGIRDLNSGPRACRPDTLPPQSSPRPHACAFTLRGHPRWKYRPAFPLQSTTSN